MKSGKVLFVLMPNGFQELEFRVPCDLLTRSGFLVDVAGLAKGPARSSTGIVVTPNKHLEAMTTQELDGYDAIVIPGGSGSPEFLWDNEDLQGVVRYFHERGKVVATICYACIVPAQAGLLEGKKATVYPTDEAKEIFAQHGVQFSPEECVILLKEKIITAQGPQQVKKFGHAIVDQLSLMINQPKERAVWQNE